MTFSEWWNRVVKGFIETANLVILTIVSVASFLTVDWVLFGIGIVLEGIYLVWASLPASYQRRLKLQARPVEVLDHILLVVTVAGLVVIFFFGFGKHLLNHRSPYLTHAEGWEAGAIVWTFFFLFYYLVKFIESGVAFSAIAVILAFVGVWLLWQAWHSMGKPLVHVPFVMAIGFCFLSMDWWSMLNHKKEKERLLSKASFWWADVPMVISFGVLWLYLYVHRDTENPDVFVSGVISCQLLISNVVFVVMEFGLLRSPNETTAGSAA